MRIKFKNDRLWVYYNMGILSCLGGGLHSKSAFYLIMLYLQVHAKMFTTFSIIFDTGLGNSECSLTLQVPA